MRLEDLVDQLSVLVEAGRRIKAQWFSPVDPSRTSAEALDAALSAAAAAEREAAPSIIRTSRPIFQILARPFERPAPPGMELLDDPESLASKLAEFGHVPETFRWSPSRSIGAPADAGPDVQLTLIMAGGTEAPATVALIHEAARLARQFESAGGEGLLNDFCNAGESDLARLVCFAATLPLARFGFGSLISAQVGDFDEWVGYPYGPLYEGPLRQRVSLRRLLEVNPDSPTLLSAIQGETEQGLRRVKGLPPILGDATPWAIMAEFPAIEVCWLVCARLLEGQKLPADAVNLKTAAHLLGVPPGSIQSLAEARLVDSWGPSSSMKFSRREMELKKGAFLTINQAADLLECEPKTIRNRIKEGSIPAFGGERGRVVRRADLEPLVGRALRRQKRPSRSAKRAAQRK